MAEQQSIWASNAGSIPLLLSVQFNFVSVSGLIPTVEVFRTSDDFIADFSDNTFKASGAVSGIVPMTEVPTDQGLYRRNFDPADFGIVTEEKFYVRYKTTIPQSVSPILIPPGGFPVLVNESVVTINFNGLGMTASFVDPQCE